MFILKQFLKRLILPPMSWILLLLVVLIFWNRRWARKLLLATLLIVIALHSTHVQYLARYGLESRYSPLIDPRQAQPYDAIVVLTGGSIPAGGLVQFPTISEAMFRRLDEAWRLYRILPKPIIVSGGHVDPFTSAQDETKIPRDYLILWGVPSQDVIVEPDSRDTFESAIEVKKILDKKGWKRYLLVTSALHMPRSMLVFQSVAPSPIAAPGDFTVRENLFSPLEFFPSAKVAEEIRNTFHEYLGLLNYRVRALFYDH
jgi:uncharacterized SAM-binding protein YcdF (DUF218 family)